MADWHPLGARRELWYTPEPGEIVAWDYRVWRVVSVIDRPRDLWDAQDEAAHLLSNFNYRVVTPVVVVLRPVAITSQDPSARNHDKHLRVYRNLTHWSVYPDEHYPMCGTCQEPLPCKEIRIRREIDSEMTRVARYETAGVCPACAEPVSQRQKSIVFDDNIFMPGGPVVTFHLRGRCHHSAMTYEKAWHKADPEHRPLTLSCSGSVTTHRDGTYDCNANDGCPGPLAVHMALQVCNCPEETCHGPVRGCRLRPGMTRRTRS